MIVLCELSSLQQLESAISIYFIIHSYFCVSVWERLQTKKDITLQTLAGCCLSFSLVHTPQNV